MFRLTEVKVIEAAITLYCESANHVKAFTLLILFVETHELAD